MKLKNRQLNSDKKLQAYVIGLAIGDGNLSNPSGKATKLRITCDKKYPLLIKRIIKSLNFLLPKNKVTIVKRKENYLDISVYSNYLENLLGWKAKKGSKFIQKVCIPNWIKQKRIYKINCLKGLIETDGSIYNNRGYKMVIFTTIILKLANDVYKVIKSLGFKPHIYKIKQGLNKKYNFYQQTLYHIRLSKNVKKFLALVKSEKK